MNRTHRKSVVFLEIIGFVLITSKAHDESLQRTKPARKFHANDEKWEEVLTTNFIICVRKINYHS